MIGAIEFIARLTVSGIQKNALAVVAKNSAAITNEVNQFTKAQVEAYTNQKIIDSEENAIGSKNSLDIVNQNTSSTDFINTLKDPIETDLGPVVSDAYFKSIKKYLVNELSGSVSDATLKEEIGSTLDSMGKTNVSRAFEDKSTSLFSGTTQNNIMSVIGGILGGSFALDSIDSIYSNSLANKTIQEVSKFDVNNSDNQDKVTKTTKGFNDPKGTFPTQDYSDLADTNKLAQGDVRGTVMQDRIKNPMRGAKLPNGESWDQPASSYKAQYPYNKVMQTESGHIIEIDDTPGAERIHVYHKSGSYIEIDPNGSVISKTVGSEYKIIDCNGYISIAGKANVSVNGSCNVHVGGDCNLEVIGDAIVNSSNDIQVNAAGRLQLSAGEAIDMRSPLIYVEADTEFHLKADTKANIDVQLLNVKSATNINVQSTEDINVNSGKGVFVKAAEETNIKSTGKINIQSEADINTKSGSMLKFQSVGDGSFLFGGNMAMDYATGQFANGQSVPAEESKDAGSSESAEYSKSGLLEPRVSVLENVISDPQALTLADQYSLLVENEGEDYTSQRNRLIELGLATPAELDANPIEGDSDSSVGAARTEVIPADSTLRNTTALPDSYQLSPHFTLGMLSSKAAVTKDPVVAQKGLSYGEIVYNLQNLALNVLEPIYAIYPNMIVTSAFRSEESSTGTSQHPLGMAVDIQIKGLPKSEYYSVAKKLKEFLNFDQFLLEYCSYSQNPWIHVSLTPKVNRNKIATFYNHKKHSDGLISLS